jgi:hypothetical protein
MSLRPRQRRLPKAKIWLGRRKGEDVGKASDNGLASKGQDPVSAPAPRSGMPCVWHHGVWSGVPRVAHRPNPAVIYKEAAAPSEENGAPSAEALCRAGH